MKELSPTPRRIMGHGNIELNVWDYGGKGIPLILCHCTGAVARTWDPVVARLGGAFHVYAIDSRGHGDSERPTTREAYVWALSGQDLLAVVDGLELPAPILAAGHSGGGAHIAYAEMLRPGTFSRVVLIEAIIGPEEFFSSPSPLAAAARRRVNDFESRKAARDRFAAKPPMNRWHPEALEAYLEHGLATLPDGRVSLKLPGEIEAWMYELGGAYDVYDQLGNLHFQALLATGSESYGVALVSAQHSRLPDSEYRTIEGAHHFAPQERPTDVAGLLIEWLAGAQTGKTRNFGKNST